MRVIALALVILFAACEPAPMGLPHTRETNATPADKVDSNTMNVVQDCIIGSKHGDRVKTFSGALGHGQNVGQGEEYVKLDNGSGIWVVPLIGFVGGDRLKSITISAQGDGASDGSAQLKIHTAADPDSPTFIGLVDMIDIPAAPAWTQYVLDGELYVLAAGDLPVVTFPATSGPDIQIGNIFVTYDHP